MKDNLKPASRLIHAGRVPAEHHGTVNPPIYRASTILQPNLEAWEESRKPSYTGYRYGLSGTPTTRGFETAMAELYGVDQCVAVSSGLAAATTALTAVTKAGDHILVTDSVYEPTRTFCDRVLRRYGVTVEYYDPRIGAGISRLMRPETRLIFAESPGSLTFEIQDVPALVQAAHAGRAVLLLDNTWASALLFRPFEHGVDIVIEAVTKYVAGHADVLMGVMLAKGNLGKELRTTARILGNCCGPEELYLAQRGLRSMAVRLERCAVNADRLADWLVGRPEVKYVLHAPRPDHPDHALWRRDFSGSNGLFAMLLHPLPRPALSAFFDGFRLFGIGASWGGFESLIMPAHPERVRTAVPWTEEGHLVRLHAGLEDADDLIADLAAAFARTAAVEAG